MNIFKSVLASLLFILSISTMHTDAMQTIFVADLNTMGVSHITGKDVLAACGVIGIITASGYAIYKIFDVFYWTRKRTEKWAYKAIQEIESRNAFTKEITDFSEHNMKLIELATNFGFRTKQSGFDCVLQAAAPLHSTVNSLTYDIQTLCSIIKECGRKHFIAGNLIDNTLRFARLLKEIVYIICNTNEYKKEAVEIEKITNGRHSSSVVLVTRLGISDQASNQK